MVYDDFGVYHCKHAWKEVVPVNSSKNYGAKLGLLQVQKLRQVMINVLVCLRNKETSKAYFAEY